MQVRYFAAAAEAAGTDAEVISAEKAGTVAQLQELLAERHGAALADVLTRCSFLVNGQGADPSDPLGDLVDVLPPFAGG